MARQYHVPLAFGPGGIWGTDLYAINVRDGELWRLEVLANGTLGDSEVVGTGFDSTPADIEFGPDGALYVSLHTGRNILRILPEPASVEVDIKPGSYPNSINLGSHGVVPVAILSSATFDATQVDAETVLLSGAGVAVRGRGNNLLAHEEDVDADGLMDLVVQVETENLNPDAFQDGYAILTGETYDGQPFEGIDEITIVP